jgi:hypothetical protein
MSLEATSGENEVNKIPNYTQAQPVMAHVFRFQVCVHIIGHIFTLEGYFGSRHVGFMFKCII